MKCIEKELLEDSVLAHEFAQRELALHSQMQHENIISVLSICETATRYLMYMEYAGFESGYFARKIAQRKAITNQKSLRPGPSSCLALSPTCMGRAAQSTKTSSQRMYY